MEGIGEGMEKHKRHKDLDIGEHVLYYLCLGLTVKEEQAYDLWEKPNDEHNGNYEDKALYKRHANGLFYLVIFFRSYTLRNIGGYRSGTVAVEQ